MTAYILWAQNIIYTDMLAAMIVKHPKTNMINLCFSLFDNPLSEMFICKMNAKSNMWLLRILFAWKKPFPLPSGKTEMLSAP